MNNKKLFSILMTMLLLLLLTHSVNKTVYATEKSNPDHVTISMEHLNQYASRTVYTVQTGSFMSSADAQQQFDIIVQGLSKNDLDYLRIEKIGIYYTVRIGKFEDSVNADKFLQAMKSMFPAAVRLKAYIKGDRITKIYRGSSLVDKHTIDKKVLADSKAQTTGQQNTKKRVRQTESEIYTIQTGSFMNFVDAKKKYDAMLQGANTSNPAYDLSYLRIEKTGKTYSVRIGNFENYKTAKNFLQTIKAGYPNALIIKDILKDARIIKLYQR